jgi:hypothetical protein
MKKVMPDEPPYYLDIEGLEDEPNEERNPRLGRPWIGVDFECCGVYSRIYRNKEGTAYIGNCPKCSRQVRVRVGPGGTSNRMFRAR